MSAKRSRAAYEADLQAKQSPFVAYGTPLPPADPDVRDGGAYVPEWKQEVTDERGRRRLHGAFTGGYSAGFFNTVGSKEGWAPSTFVSSRTNRRKDESKTERRPEDFMDEEDLADAAEHQRVQTAGGFAGLGTTEGEVAQRDAFVDLFKPEGETMGVKLLKKMGWREGQGIGPKVQRAARLGDDQSAPGQGEVHFFAPEDTRMVTFEKKGDRKGLGFEGPAKLASEERDGARSEGEEPVFGTAKPSTTNKSRKPVRGGIGIGVLNDTGSDDEDPYEIGPRISYNKVIGGDKKKKTKMPANTAVKPVFISKKAAAARAALGLRKCHDGRLPLDGFVLSDDTDSLAAEAAFVEKYRPPPVPEGWQSSKGSTSGSGSAKYVSNADASKASNLDPKSRAALLGETPLPGKSVFDFLSSTARDRIAASSGKPNLPAARGEVPEGYALTPEEKQRELASSIPSVDSEAAVAALGRGASGWMPYADDEPKRARYRCYLEIQAGMRDGLPERAPNVSKDDWLRELHEFARCAHIFKPMTGMMANRFTTSSATTNSTGDPADTPAPAPKPEDPAEAAAKVGMFGRMTRSEADWYPSRLLCKRFGVKAPAHVEAGADKEEEGPSQPISKSDIDELIRESAGRGQWTAAATGGSEETRPGGTPQTAAVIDVERNDALEGEKAGEAVFKSIFGDDSDED